jgi:hypothetical protein
LRSRTLTKVGMHDCAGISGLLQARRFVSLLVLVSLLSAHIPIPIKLPPPGKDHSARYPCENNPCGCLSAEQCWQNCCCRTNAEKLAWAKANGVTPPDYVVAAADQEAADEPAPRSCCSQHGKCCSHDSDAVTHCEPQAAPSSPRMEDDSEDGDAAYVIGIMAQHCRGLSSHWLNLPWMIVEADMPMEMSVPGTHCGVAEYCFAPDVTDRPPTPPPRAASAAHTC